MAQQKMHGTVQSTYSGYKEASEGEIGYSLRNSLVQDNLTPSSEDCEISSFNSRNSDKRCAILTLYEPVHWRIVAVPLQCLDQSSQLGSRVPVNKDGLQLVSPSSINSFKVDRRKVPKGPPCDVTYSVNSFTRPFPGSDVRYQSRNRTLTNKVTKLNKFPMNSSSHSSVTYSNSSDINPHSSDPFKSSVIVNENSKVDKGVKRNSRKKARMKGKQNKKLSPTTVFTEPEVFSEDYRHCSSTSLSSGNNDIDHSDGLIFCATSQDDSLSESRDNTISSESPKTSASYTDEGEVLEAKEPSRVENFPGEQSVIDYKVGIKMEGQRFSITDGGLEERHNLQSSYCDGIHLNGFSDIYHSQVLDSVSVGSNSDISTGTSSDAKPCDEANNKISLSEARGFNSRKGRFSPPNLYNSDVDFCDYTEGSRHGNRGLNSTGMQVVATGKRDRQAKIVPRGSSAYRHGTVGNLHGRTGRENSHSVWQRVQKKDVDQSNSELLKELSAVCSQPHVTLKDASLLRRKSNVAVVNMLSKAEDNKQLKDKVSRKSKRKTSPGSKKEYNSYSQKGLYPSKVCSNVHTEIGIQHNEILDTSKQVNEQKRVSNVSRSCSQIGCLEFSNHCGSIKSLNSESFPSSKDCKHNVESHESVCNTISGVETHNQVKSLAKSGGSYKMKMCEVRSPIYLPHLLFNEVAQREKNVPVAEYSKQNQSSVSFSQKWIPTGTKDPQNTISARCGSFSLTQSDRQGAENWTLRNNINQKAASHSHDLVASSNVRTRSMAPASESITSNEGKNKTHKLRNMNADAFHQTSNEYVTANCLTSESKTMVETDSNKILRAVNDASRVQLASEAVWMASGSPIAEFERLLHFSSPVICHSLNLISCKDCSLDRVGSSLCRHETPSVSLGCLWQWYEKHGSFGLEIRAEDFEQTKRLGVDRFSFRAYFVPLLSAIQLFRNSKCHSMKNSGGVNIPGVAEASKTGETLRSSTNVGHLPIYSLLVPQPRTAASAKAKEDSSVPSVNLTCSNDPELLFEYFESEQPRQRRPLYEKIQELVNGDGLSQHQLYGDPSNLNSINLQDLHPRSWYSVAWYPIYSIPDSNFRAAFLTYHSLGHMIRRSAEVDSANTESFVVSPVVGLHSYNTQGECWFQLRPSVVSQATENPNLNPSGILKERLTTLEKTASLIARAVINKGDQKSLNRHPDYEFFLSRQRNGLA